MKGTVSKRTPSSVKNLIYIGTQGSPLESCRFKSRIAKKNYYTKMKLDSHISFSLMTYTETQSKNRKC